MSTIDELQERKSVRVFEDRPVPQNIREQILDCALAAPTARNQMLYTIIEVDDPAAKTTLAKSCAEQDFIAKAPWVLVFLADCRRWFDAFAFAGCDAVQPDEADLYLAFADAQIAAQNTVTAAHSLGLGSCYVGYGPAHKEIVGELLELDEYVVPVAVLILGYPDGRQEAKPKPSRFAREYIVQKDKYHRLSEDEQREMFARRGVDLDRLAASLYHRKHNSRFSAELTLGIQGYLAAFSSKK
ncbi:MAG: nitroreductase family protein [Propionibacteriaceae bacterium]|jgi:nitroreductase|nr:nitroreductase family protein [Propionibacteriaceae bacterium]